METKEKILLIGLGIVLLYLGIFFYLSWQGGAFEPTPVYNSCNPFSYLNISELNFTAHTPKG